MEDVCDARDQPVMPEASKDICSEQQLQAVLKQSMNDDSIFRRRNDEHNGPGHK